MKPKVTALIAAALLAAVAGYTAGECLRPPTDAELLAELKKQRQARIQELEDYVKQGAFPHNHELKGKRQPYLMDAHGSLCAVGYLVAASQVEGFDYSRFRTINQTAWSYSSASPPDPDFEAMQREEERKNAKYSGVSALFKKLAAANNKVRMMDVEEGPIADWVLTSGLTLEECALIQPGYSFLNCRDCTGMDDRVGFGEVTADASKVIEADRERISTHLTAVSKTLKAQTDESLATAFARLKTSRLPATSQ